MLARAVVLVLAVVIAGFAAVGQHDYDACQSSGTEVFQAVVKKRPVTAAVVDAYMADCRGSHPLAITANALAAAGRVGQSLRLSDEAIRREPENYEGWAALAAALRKRGLDAAADRALRHARQLNPRFGTAPG